jgi:hypothetical protein
MRIFAALLAVLVTVTAAVTGAQAKPMEKIL